MDCLNLLVAAVVAMVYAIVIINGEQGINFKHFNLIKTCGQGTGLVLGQSLGVPSTIHCSTLCGDEAECCSFVYDPLAMACILHDNSVNDPSSLPEDCGIIIGQKDDAICSAFQPCVGLDDCTSSWCRCPTGCSFDPRIWRCVDYCSEYGTTFQNHPGHMIWSYNDDYETAVKSADECQMLCTTTSTFVCRSVDYNFRAKICFLSSETALSQPGAYEARSCCDHFARDCAP